MCHMGSWGVSIVMRLPPNGWFVVENPIEMDENWGFPMTQETSISAPRKQLTWLKRGVFFSLKHRSDPAAATVSSP